MYQPKTGISKMVTPKKTDPLFVSESTKLQLKGNADALIRLIEKVQLKDVALWKLFVQQFRGTPDDRDHGWRCEFFGKLMRGGCFVWAYTRDEELYGILTDAIEDMLTTQDEQGRFSTYSLGIEFSGWDMWGRKYVLLGFSYYLEICRDEELAQRIIAAMQRHADYIMEHVGPGQEQIGITDTSDFWGGLNSSSILEPFMHLYLLTGASKYLDYARYIVENGGIADGDLVALALEGKRAPYEYPVTKAYEMMSFFEGVLEYYRVTGDEKYRTAVENFARLVAETDITVIGCAGCTHELFDHSAMRQTDPANMIIMQETCVTVTWMKLCLQLLCLTGEAKYADWIEVSAYNGLFGSVNTEGVTKNNGFPFDSYSPLLPNKRGRATGGHKVMENGVSYGCCAAIGACGMGIFPKAMCLNGEAGLTLSLYNDGEICSVLPDGNSLKMEISGGYPINGAIRLVLHPKKAASFLLQLRIPAWSKEESLNVTGDTEDAIPGTYAKLQRLWQDGDVVELVLDVRTRQMVQNGFVTFLRGPLVLARDGRLGEDITYPIRPDADEDGFVKTLPSNTATFPVQLEEKVQLLYGKTITVVDYASAGKTWDYDSLMAAWLPLEME